MTEIQSPAEAHGTDDLKKLLDAYRFEAAQVTRTGLHMHRDPADIRAEIEQRFAALSATQPKGLPPIGEWQALDDDALASIEAWAMVDRKVIIPVDAYNLRNMLAHMVREVRATRAAVQAPAPAPTAPMTWCDGPPPFPQDQEWFIAETIYGDRVALIALEEGRRKTMDWEFKTADGTYLKRASVKRWMQFPDCMYLPPAAETAAPAVGAGWKVEYFPERDEGPECCLITSPEGFVDTVEPSFGKVLFAFLKTQGGA